MGMVIYLVKLIVRREGNKSVVAWFEDQEDIYENNEEIHPTL